MIARPAQSGFSLVELSIVLVILGLLTGGILGGQALIRAAELRTVATDYARFATAAQTFRDKYFAIPGDMANATAFWGKSAADCNAHAGTAATPGTCNGDGNGQISWASAANSTGEAFQFWKQLALAGLVEGTFSGISGSGHPIHSIIGVNVPRGKLSNSSFGVTFYVTAGDAFNYGLNYGNQMTFGAANGIFDASGPILRPEESWNIDTKLDDGRPATGSIINAYWDQCTTSTSFSDFSGQYDLSVSTNSCALRYRNFL